MAAYVQGQQSTPNSSTKSDHTLLARDAVPDVICRRRSAKYHPSVWGDHFISNAPADHHFSEVDSGLEKQHQELKELVRAKLIMINTASLANDSNRREDVIDQIQRLGISYHFEPEIELALQQIYDAYQKHDNDNDVDDDDLHSTALRFRLLRQQGYNISCDCALKKLKDDEGKFKESLSSDVRGMLSLYEAAHMRVRGEDLLEEALEFTTNHLQSMISHLNDPLVVKQVSHALKNPIRKSLQRLQSRHYIAIFQDDKSIDEVFLSFAKLDFNLLQKFHQRELSDISRWWKDLGVVEKLPYARDRIVECYFWIMGVYFEPHYHLARTNLTKVIAVTSILDDTYDNYGTLEELRLLTDAIERWDVGAMDHLPEYMRVCYRALLDVYSKIEKDLASQLQDQKSAYYRVPYAKAAMKELVRAYLDEAKWYYEDYTPTMDEYMKVAMVTGAYKMLATNALVGMEDEFVNEETFAWVSNDPLIVRASSVICRLMDDMAGHEFEQERGHTASGVECYMKQHRASKEEVYAIFENQVIGAWKDVNQECIHPTAVPLPVLTRVLNLARVIYFLYSDGDCYTDSRTKTKSCVASLLIQSVP